ncbi:MAG: sporulation protein YabP [Ruminococcus sp.]|nr:sporulation protein YabP [Ruminococcus sp.]MCD7773028.1 sporulation protein YabP [Ruminococcus sp.]
MNEKVLTKPSDLTLQNRSLLRLTGVTDIDSFNEEAIVLFTTLGELVIKGKNLHVNSVNVDSGDAEIVGEIRTISYTNRKLTKKPNAIKRLMR